MNHWIPAGMRYIYIPTRVRRRCKSARVSIGKTSSTVPKNCSKTLFMNFFTSPKGEGECCGFRPTAVRVELWGFTCRLLWQTLNHRSVNHVTEWVTVTVGWKESENTGNTVFTMKTDWQHFFFLILSSACIERLHNKPLHTQYCSQLSLTKMHYLVIQYVHQAHQL